MEAKRRLLSNTSTNMLNAVLSAAVGLYLTPYLIANLGVEVYGVVPLVTSVVAYYALLTSGLASAVGRFVSIEINRGDVPRAVVYFSSAMLAVLVLCAAFGVAAVALSPLMPRVFRIPAGFEGQTAVMFALVSIGTLIAPVSGVFQVSTFVRHRFDLQNVSRFTSRLLKAVVIVAAFTWVGKSLAWVGIGFLAMAVHLLVFSWILTRRLTPELVVRCGAFEGGALREMAGMSVWVTLNQVKSLLFFNIGMIVINLFLGSEQVGRFAPVNQWGMLLTTLAGAVSTVFSPIAYELVARERFDELVGYTNRATKYMGLLMALPIGLLCGLAAPLLEWWLGAEFTDLAPLMWLVAAPRILNLSISPMLAVRGGLNRVKVPALFGLAGAVVNLGLSIYFVRWTELGILGVALATMISLNISDLCFTPVYTAHILGRRKTIFYRALPPVVLAFAVTAAAAWLVARTLSLASFGGLLVAVIAAAAVYLPACYLLVLNGEDRAFLRSLLPAARGR